MLIGSTWSVRRVVASAAILGSLLILSFYIYKNHILEQQLHDVYKVVLQETFAANITGDTSTLRRYMTMAAIERLEENRVTLLVGDVVSFRDIELVSFSLVDHGENWAIASVIHNYTPSVYYIETGEGLPTGDDRTWEGQKILMILEEGNWKFDHVIESEGWGILSK